MAHSAMVEYRFFVLNTADQVQSSSFALCEDDVEAAQHAASVADGAAIEVWDVGRLVFRLGATPPGSSVRRDPPLGLEPR